MMKKTYLIEIIEITGCGLSLYFPVSFHKYDFSHSRMLPRCGSYHITRAGKITSREQRYRCQVQECSTITFILDYRYTAYQPNTKEYRLDSLTK